MKVSQLITLPLNEANVQTDNKDLKDIVKYFPSTTQKVVNALVKSDRLTYNGTSVMDDLYQKLENTASERAQKANATINIDIPSEDFPNLKGTDTVEFYIDEVELEVSDLEEVYLGYDASNDTFTMGFDAWFDEEAFWEKINKVADKKRIDSSSDEFHAYCDKIWKHLKRTLNGHVLVNIKFSGNSVVVKRVDAGVGLFYKSAYKRLKAENSDMIDIRLD